MYIHAKYLTRLAAKDVTGKIIFVSSGCNLAVRAPALGAGDRRFRSSHPTFLRAEEVPSTDPKSVQRLIERVIGVFFAGDRT
jgi:hypothetical protein